MKSTVDRRTVDLSAYPDLVVIYLGMRVNTFKGMNTARKLGAQIAGSVAARPDGLLLHENFFFSLFPLHGGMRQYWRDYESLEAWTRTLPHQKWWTDFMRDTGGTGFWHEMYSMRGGIEAIYDNIPEPIGMMNFAPVVQARGAMFSSRKRLEREGEAATVAPVSEGEIYGPS